MIFCSEQAELGGATFTVLFDEMRLESNDTMYVYNAYGNNPDNADRVQLTKNWYFEQPSNVAPMLIEMNGKIFDAFSGSSSVSMGDSGGYRNGDTLTLNLVVSPPSGGHKALKCKYIKV